MDQDQKQALQVAKEIVVKFIETNRISPNTFPELFEDIYRSVLRTIRTEHEPDGAGPDQKHEGEK